jgi:hypothetical protein
MWEPSKKRDFDFAGVSAAGAAGAATSIRERDDGVIPNAASARPSSSERLRAML